MDIKIKKFVGKIAATFIVAFGLFVNSIAVSYAFPSVLGSKTAYEQSIFVDGHEVKSPENPIVADSSKPVFFGYTEPNAEIHLIIKSDPIEDDTLSDAEGYWKYNVEEDLEAGQHTLSLQITGAKGTESDEVLAATFIVPEVKAASTSIDSNTTPLPKNPSYLIVTFVVVGSLLILGGVYALILKKPRVH